MPWTKEYRCWVTLRNRCNNPNKPDYPYYGGRGIKVCRRWDSFDNFLADMGQPPSPVHTIERRNNNGNYEPSNCYWATRLEQSRNRDYCVIKPGILSTVYRLYDVEKRSQREIAEQFGVTQAAISKVLRSRPNHRARRNEPQHDYRLRKLRRDDYPKIANLYRQGYTQKELASRFGVVQCHISRIVRQHR